MFSLFHTFYVPSLCAPRLCTYSTLRPQGSENPAEELRCVLAVIRHGDRTPKQVQWKRGLFQCLVGEGASLPGGKAGAVERRVAREAPRLSGLVGGGAASLPGGKAKSFHTSPPDGYASL